MPDTTTISLPQLRDALRRLEANVSADELWDALHQTDLPLPAPSLWPVRACADAGEGWQP